MFELDKELNQADVDELIYSPELPSEILGYW